MHRHDGELAGLTLPWGLALAVTAAVLVAAACTLLVRVGAAWFGLGWTLAVVAQQTTGPQSYLVAGDALGWAFMGLGLGGIAVVVVRAPRLER